jgi:hypothetical protein
MELESGQGGDLTGVEFNWQRHSKYASQGCAIFMRMVFAGDPMEKSSAMKAPVPAGFRRWNFA